MTRLSVNINKIATVRNARGGNMPDVTKAALDCEKFGAEGITVHPRPDERHIRYSDVRTIRPLITTEFNIEGNPIPSFISQTKHGQGQRSHEQEAQTKAPILAHTVLLPQLMPPSKPSQAYCHSPLAIANFHAILAKSAPVFIYKWADVAGRVCQTLQTKTIFS